MEIEIGKLYYMQLPGSHPIRKFCEKHEIKNTAMQDEIADMVSQSLYLLLNSLSSTERLVGRVDTNIPESVGGE